MQIEIEKNVKNLKIADHRYLYYNKSSLSTEPNGIKYINTYFLHTMPPNGFDMRMQNFKLSLVTYQVFSYIKGQRYCIGQFERLNDAQYLLRHSLGDPTMYAMDDDQNSIPCCPYCGGVSSQWSIPLRRCTCENIIKK